MGVFTTALREAMEEGRVDAAVHSHKDLPTADDAKVCCSGHTGAQ